MGDLFKHSNKKRKDSLETRVVILIFSLELEIFGVAVQSIHQNSEKWRLWWGIAQRKWLRGCFSHFLLLWPWCQGFWSSPEYRHRSKEYRKCSLCVIICWIAKMYLSINNSEKWLVTGIPLTQLKKLHRKKSNNWPNVYNGNEITTWMGHSFKTKTQNPEQHF